MGQQGSALALPSTGRCRGEASFTPEEQATLQEALGVAEDTPESSVRLLAFLGRFPAHLRPLVQPLFFRLALEPGARASCWRGRRVCDGERQLVAGGSVLGGTSPTAGATSPSSSLLAAQGEADEEPSAPWPRIVSGVSSLVREGASWPVLLEAWVGEEGSDPCAGERAEAAAELAAALCFWCAHPSRTPGPGVPGGVPPSAAASALAGLDPEPLDTVLAALRRPRPKAEGGTGGFGLGGAVAPLQNSSGGGSGSSSAVVQARLVEHSPCLPESVGPRLAQALLEAPQPPDCLWPPQSCILDRGLAFLLRGLSKALWASGPWELLYGDQRDGRSFSALLRGVLRYPSLALLVLRAASGGEVLGALSDFWEEGSGLFGGSQECLLFTLWPTLQAFRSTGRCKNFAYLNSRSKSAPRGLGFGGQAGCCRLWIAPDLEECQVLTTDATYGSGPLLLTGTGEHRSGCQISHLEVWGLGGPAARAQQRAAQAAMQQRAAGT